MYLHMYTYAYIHTYTQIYVQIHICMRIYMNTHACICIHEPLKLSCAFPKISISHILTHRHMGSFLQANDRAKDAGSTVCLLGRRSQQRQVCMIPPPIL